jgi:hypothetical protein
MAAVFNSAFPPQWQRASPQKLWEMSDMVQAAVDWEANNMLQA